MTALLALLLLPVLQTGAPAPAVVALASPSADTVLSADPACQDLELMRLAAGDPWARLWLPVGAWHALLGDADVSGTLDAPAGIDALAWDSADPAAPRGALNLWFSSDSDFLGFKDGDVLRVNAAGAVEVVYAEDAIRQALGTSAAFDLDAIELDVNGFLWFSLRDAVSASALGALEDGDVLVYDPAAGTAWIHATEAQVQAWVDAAMPGAGALGDLKSLAFDPLNGALVFTVQSPSSADASVFSAANGGSLLPDFEEPRWGFLQSAELDALTLSMEAPSQPPVLTATAEMVAPAQTFGLDIRHASPNGSLYGMVGSVRKLISTRRGGFGYVAFDLNGPTRTWPSPQSGAMHADASGTVNTTFTAPALPPGHAMLDLIFQAWDITGAQLSTPVLVRVL